MRIIKTGNMFQVEKDNIGTVFQSHSKDECMKYIREHTNSICTLDWKYTEVCRPVKYSEVIKP